MRQAIQITFNYIHLHYLQQYTAIFYYGEMLHNRWYPVARRYDTQIANWM